MHCTRARASAHARTTSAIACVRSIVRASAHGGPRADAHPRTCLRAHSRHTRAHKYSRAHTRALARAHRHARARIARSFVRPPKCVGKELKDAMKLHVPGVIFHGRTADKRADRIRSHRHASTAARTGAFRPVLADVPSCIDSGAQLVERIDNASDNKSRTVMTFFAWMVAIGWVKEVTISMMAPGHTHEDIDALFKRIVE
eukprot:6213251-Pleurochrysis_carterae.AAC.4